MKRHHIVFLLFASVLFGSACVLERGLGGFFEEGRSEAAQQTAAVEATVWNLLQTDEAAEATESPGETPAATIEPTQHTESLPDSSVEETVNCDMSYLTPGEKLFCGEHTFQVVYKISEACSSLSYNVDGEQVKERTSTLTFTISFTETSGTFGVFEMDKVSPNHYATTWDGFDDDLPFENEIINSTIVSTKYHIETKGDEPVGCDVATYTIID